jgi:hypothetical protein
MSKGLSNGVLLLALAGAAVAGQAYAPRWTPQIRPVVDTSKPAS